MTNSPRENILYEIELGKMVCILVKGLSIVKRALNEVIARFILPSKQPRLDSARSIKFSEINGKNKQKHLWPRVRNWILLYEVS